MQLRILPSIIIFTGSYLPLSMILFVQDINYTNLTSEGYSNIFAALANCKISLSHPFISTSILIACLTCFILTLSALEFFRVKNKLKVQDHKYIPTDLMNYSLPYVVSFMSIGYEETSKFIGLIIFLAWMFLITYKAGQVILNPVLIVFGWKLYDVTYIIAGDTTGKKHSKLLLSKHHLSENSSYKFCEIQNVLISK